MLSVLFTNTLMLAGMAALAVPVLIHLLLKRKKKKVPFSTIRFFQQQDEQSSRRRKLRNWFLLALRLLIVSLLVLAFSRPYSRQGQASAAGGKRHRVVFVLDRSASMLATGTEGQRWGLAKERVQRVISTLEAEDVVALIECAAQVNVVSGFAPPASVTQVLRNLTPAYGISSLSDGLRQAVGLLAGNSSDWSSTIYLVTDLQKSACRGLNACPVPQDIEFKILEVGDLAAPNLAVVRLDAESVDGARPQVGLASFSDEDGPSANLELAVDGRTFATQAVVLKAGASTNLDIVFPPLKPGWHDLKATLRARDALEADNSRFACFFVPEPVRVLVVEPRGSARVFEQASFFLNAALDPTQGATNRVPAGFEVSQTSPEGLARALGGAVNDRPWNVVVMPGLKDLPSGIGKELMTFVKAGSGLVLFLDEGMSANRYNGELADLLPARIGGVDSNPEVGLPWRIAFYDTNSPAFSAFRFQNTGDLRIPEFTKRYALEVPEGATRLAFFDDGVPLVVTREVGRGLVALVNTTADTGWNDWPKHKTFVPFLHGLTKFAAQRTGQEKVRDEINYVAGEAVELETGTQGRLAKFSLRQSDGKEIHLMADAGGRLKDAGMDLPGTYSLRDQTEHEIKRIAVNLAPQESNLEALRPAEFMQQLVRTQDNRKQTLAAGLFGARHDQREFWAALLLGALVLLLVEPFVANRTSV